MEQWAIDLICGGEVLVGDSRDTHAGSAARVTLNVPGFVVTLLLTVCTANLQNVFRDETALFTAIVNNDLDWLLTPMAGETEIKAVRGSFH